MSAAPAKENMMSKFTASQHMAVRALNQGTCHRVSGFKVMAPPDIELWLQGSRYESAMDVGVFDGLVRRGVAVEVRGRLGGVVAYRLAR